MNPVLVVLVNAHHFLLLPYLGVNISLIAIISKLITTANPLGQAMTIPQSLYSLDHTGSDQNIGNQSRGVTVSLTS